MAGSCSTYNYAMGRFLKLIGRRITETTNVRYGSFSGHHSGDGVGPLCARSGL